MKLTASMLRGAERVSPGSLRLAQAIAAAVQPGNEIAITAALPYRVLSKSASSHGYRLRIAREGGEVLVVGAAELAALHPLSPPLRRFASTLRRIVTAGIDIQLYINQAIKDAGYPVDPKMNWNKWLGAAYRPLYALTGDKEATEEAIYDTVIQELYLRNALKDSFNPDHAKTEGKELAEKVSAFLCNRFKARVYQTIRDVQTAQGSGTKGINGRIPNVGLDIVGEDGQPADYNLGDLGPSGQGEEDRYRQDAEDEREIDRFVRDYKASLPEEILKNGKRDNLATAFRMFTDMALDGASREEMRNALAVSDLRMRNGEPLTSGMCATYAKRWARSIAEFAADPENGWNYTPLGKHIINVAKRLYATWDEEKAPVTALNLAEAEGVKEEDKATAKSAAAPASSNMLGVSGTPAEENYDKVVDALAGLMVERLEAPLPEKNAAAAGSQQPIVVNQPSAPPTNPNVQQQANETAAIGNQPNQSTAPQPESDIQKPQPQAKVVQPPEIPGTQVIAAATEETMADSGKTAAKSLLASRKSPKTATKQASRYARLRRVARTQPKELEAALRELAASYTKVGSLLSNFRENLDLVSAPKTASVREKAAAERIYAKSFIRVAEENPEQLEADLQRIYSQTDEIAGAVENLADHLGLNITPEGEEPTGAPESFEDVKDDDSGDEFSAEEPVESESAEV